MSYTHLSGAERFYIEQRLVFGDSVPKIAKELGRDKTSIYREIARNTDESFGFYSHLRANNIASDRQKQAVRKEKFFDSIDKTTLGFINTEFEVRTSPEQIAAKLKDELSVATSHQTIYRYIWGDRANGGKIYEHLRRRGKRYRNKIAKEEKVKNKLSIEKRDSIDILAREAGHYEIDTVFGLEQQSFLLTIVDISTKYLLVRKIQNKEALTVYNELKKVMATTLLPFKSITSDNGCEFAEHAKFTQETGIEWYFCHPYASWERGLNENTNGLIRDFYPKRTDFRLVPEEDIKKVQNILNNRPRKILGFTTSVKSMMKHIMAIKN